MTDLSSYDTGERCEPKPWIPAGTAVSGAVPAENFGNVDFDDDEDHTVCTVHVTKTPDGVFTLHVMPAVGQDELRIETHWEE